MNAATYDRYREGARRTRRRRAQGDRAMRLTLAAHAAQLLGAQKVGHRERIRSLGDSLMARAPRVAAACALVGDATDPQTPARLRAVRRAIEREMAKATARV